MSPNCKPIHGKHVEEPSDSLAASALPVTAAFKSKQQMGADAFANVSIQSMSTQFSQGTVSGQCWLKTKTENFKEYMI